MPQCALFIDKAYIQEVKMVVERMKLWQDSVAKEHRHIYRHLLSLGIL